MRLHASNEKLGYHINGELDAKFEKDQTTGDVVGRIPALGLLAQARDEQAVTTLLGSIFAEFCDVAVENNELWDNLILRGFKIFGAGLGHRRAPSAQFLEISMRAPRSGEHQEQRKVVAEELVEEVP